MSKAKITSIELEGLYTEVFKLEMQRLLGTGGYISVGMLEQLETDIYKSLRKSRKITLFKLRHPLLWKLFGNRFYDIPDVLDYIAKLKSEQKKPEPKSTQPPKEKPIVTITLDQMQITDFDPTQSLPEPET